MRALYTITDGAQAYAFKTEMLSSLRRTWSSLAVGQCTFSAESVDWDSAPLWPHLTSLQILKNGAPWFQGKLLRVGRVGTPQREAMDYVLVDAWWDVMDVTFRQQRLVFDDEGVASYIDVTEYIYGQDPYGERLNTGEVITEALNCVLDDRVQAGLPPPFQIGDIDPDADIPWRFEQDKKCLQVINEMVMWTPDVCGYVDHTTTPPTIHIKKNANLDAATITFPSSTQRHSVRLTKREDLAVEAVLIAYKTVIPIGEIQCSRYEVEKYPVEASQYGHKRVFQTVDLASASSGGGGSTEIEMVTKALAYNTIAWWKTKLPQFDDTYNKRIAISDIQNVSYDNASAPPATWKNELTGGSVPASSNFTALQQVFRCTVRCKVWREDAHTNLLFDGRIHLATNSFTVVNGGSGTGSNFYGSASQDSGELAETKPVGLAQKYYESVHTPGWEGDFDIAERECSTDYAGNVINLVGGAIEEWATMRALPQTVELDADSGVTRIAVGLAEHLNIQDLVDLQRRARGRTVFYVYERVTGKSGGGQNLVPAAPLNNIGGVAQSLVYQDVSEKVS